MVLWEIRSYPEALGRERERILAKTELQDRYGLLWRWKATRRERALYRLGELTPKDVTVKAVRVPQEVTPPALPPAPRTTKKPVTANLGDLIPLGRQVAADLTAQGKSLTRDRLRDGIRSLGQSISTDRAGALLAQLKRQGPENRPSAVPEDEAA
ncbi:hypothetical protein MF672_050150 [Actinomadura sp. ATCC 31491]|uniref:Uncharacterized protein n=1 Tax=Actinomadura luzonensis TaxID=2805427 RepID=A0ABT0GBC9_9ACTN|nr:hypothetical protein [Actinomadura luzonensis]MCK2221920.1 hypothetical protein [Actinomadura luzonensis]